MKNATYFRLRHLIANASRDIGFCDAMVKCGVPWWDVAVIRTKALRQRSKARKAIEAMETRRCDGA